MNSDMFLARIENAYGPVTRSACAEIIETASEIDLTDATKRQRLNDAIHGPKRRGSALFRESAFGSSSTLDVLDESAFNED